MSPLSLPTSKVVTTTTRTSIGFSAALACGMPARAASRMGRSLRSGRNLIGILVPMGGDFADEFRAHQKGRGESLAGGDEAAVIFAREEFGGGFARRLDRV